MAFDDAFPLAHPLQGQLVDVNEFFNGYPSGIAVSMDA